MTGEANRLAVRNDAGDKTKPVTAVFLIQIGDSIMRP